MDGRGLTMPLLPAIARPSKMEALPPSKQALAIVAVLASMALVVLDFAMVNVALPTIAETMGVAPSRAMRVASVYQIALVMALLPCAALGESIGYRRLFRGGLLLFVSAAGIASSARSLEWLVAARFAQGIGGAAIMALGIALLRQALAAERIGAAIGWNALTVALCSAVGPTLGALIISTADWQWLFLAHLPLGLLAFAASAGLPAIGGTRRHPDAASIALNAGAFAMLLFGAEASATSSGAGTILLTASGLCFWMLVRRERPKASPLVPIDLLGDTAFRSSVIASVLCFAGQTAGLLALPFHLQQGLGETPLSTGLYLTPWPLAVALAALISGRLADRVSAASLCAAGGLLLALGLVSAALVPAEDSRLMLVASTILCGLGFGLFQVPNNRIMFLSVPIARSAAAGGMQGTARLTGQAVGAVVMSLLFICSSPAVAPRLALAIGGMFALAAALVSAARMAARVR